MPRFVPLIPLVVFALVFSARALAVLIHELGHAIPLLIFSREKVTVHIGSYGDRRGTLHLNLRLFEMWVQYNPLLWRAGLCAGNFNKLSINQRIVCIALGPTASILVAITALILIVTFSMPAWLKVFLPFFMISAIIDLYFNLAVTSRFVHLDDGSSTFNDAAELKRLLSWRKMEGEYGPAFEQFQKGNYAVAVKVFEKFLANHVYDADTYRMILFCHLKLKNYGAAKRTGEGFVDSGFNLTAHDYVNVALAFTWAGWHSDSLEYYDKALQLEPRNAEVLNNKGYTLNLLGRYTEAIPFFDKAIVIDRVRSYPHNNRGLAKIKTGMPEEGFRDIEYALALDSQNAYAFRNLGIYYMDRKEYVKALDHFEKAKKIDPKAHQLDELMAAAEKGILTAE